MRVTVTTQDHDSRTMAELTEPVPDVDGSEVGDVTYLEPEPDEGQRASGDDHGEESTGGDG